MKNESLYKKGPSVEHFPWPEIPNISQNKGASHRSLFLPMAEPRVNHAHCRSWSWCQRSSCFKATTTSLSPPYKLEPKMASQVYYTQTTACYFPRIQKRVFLFGARASFSRCRVIAGVALSGNISIGSLQAFYSPPKTYKSATLAHCAPHLGL